MTAPTLEQTDEYTPFERLLDDDDFWADFEKTMAATIAPVFTELFKGGAYAGLAVQPKPHSKGRALKYSDDQERDDNGRWTSGGGSSPLSTSARLTDRAIRQGGFTYQPATRHTPKTGFALSIYADREKVIDGKPTVADVRAYLADNADAFKDKSNHFGAWLDTETGKTYLDVSKVVQDEAEAKALSREHKQIAYFDLGSGQSVYVKKSAVSAGAVPSGNDGRRDPRGDRQRIRLAVKASPSPVQPQANKFLTSEELDAIATKAMRAYTGPFATSIADSTKRSIRDAVIKARSEGTGTEGVFKAIKPLFSPDRALVIAVTETTKMFGLGTQAMYTARGVSYWNWETCQDDYVDAECEQMVEDGPYPIDEPFEPAHVGCRCWLSPSEDEPKEKAMMWLDLYPNDTIYVETRAAFDETKHPRADNGRFGSGSSSPLPLIDGKPVADVLPGETDASGVTAASVGDTGYSVLDDGYSWPKGKTCFTVGSAEAEDALKAWAAVSGVTSCGVSDKPDIIVRVVDDKDPSLKGSGGYSGAATYREAGPDGIIVQTEIVVARNSAGYKPLLIHEIGHALGLGHSGNPDSIMATTLGKQVVTQDDIDGIRSLWGATPAKPKLTPRARLPQVTKGLGFKYSDDQERDESGRWTSGGGGAGEIDDRLSWDSGLASHESLSEAEAKYLSIYVETGYLVANGYLRTGVAQSEHQNTAAWDTVFEHMDALIARSTVSENTTVYRGVNVDRDGKTPFDGLKPGDVIKDKAYVSTTLSPTVAKGFQLKGRSVEIRIPAGHSALYIPNALGRDDAASNREYEMLLPRSSSFRVASANDGRAVLDLL